MPGVFSRVLRPLKVINLSKDRDDDEPQRGPREGGGSRVAATSHQRAPGEFMSTQHRDHSSPNRVQRAAPYVSDNLASRDPRNLEKDHRGREEGRGPAADPTRAYKPSTGPQYSVQTLLPVPPRKSLPSQNNSSRDIHRDNSNSPLPEPTLNHRSAEILQSQPPTSWRDPHQTFTDSNEGPRRAMSWEGERPQRMQGGSQSLKQVMYTDDLRDRLWSKVYDAADFEDLNIFERTAWGQLVKQNVLLRSLNAHDKNRLQILSAIEVSHSILKDEIQHLRRSDLASRKEAEATYIELTQAYENWERQLERMKSDQAVSEKQKLEEQASRIAGQYDTQLHSQGQRIAALKDELEMKEVEIRAFFQGELDRKQAEFLEAKQHLQEGYTNLERAKDRKIRQIESDHATEFEDYKKQSDELLDEEEKRTTEAIKQGEARAAQLKDEHAAEKARMEEDIAVLRETYEIQIKQKDEEHLRMLDKMRLTHQESQQELIRIHADQEKKMVQNLSDLQSTHEISQQELTKTYEDKEQKMVIMLNNLRWTHEKDQKDLICEHHKKEQNMNDEHQIALDSLKAEIDALDNVLLTRDNESYTPAMLSEVGLKQAPDEYVKIKFAEVVQIVDDLSRLIWKADQKVWTDEVLNSVGTKQTQRLRKKGILQDTIWSIAHRHVLCSPFRMFGEEGRKLEKQWKAAYGTDPAFDNGVYTWPPLSIETERWRYITLNECRKALIEPTSQYDPRARLKIGFKTGRDAFVAELKRTLDDMIQWGNTDVSIVEKFVKRVSNVWLELGMYRCRFIVFFKATLANGGAEEKVKAVMTDGGLDFNVTPGLRRYGNVKGVQLTQSMIVGGFEGECVRLCGEGK